MAGRQTGPPCQKLPRLAENFCDAVARKVAEGSANVRRQLFSALLFVIVERPI